MSNGTEERDPSVIDHVEQTNASINEPGEGLGMRLSSQGFEQLKSVENEVFSTKIIGRERMVCSAPSRAVQTNYSPRLTLNTCPETCKLDSHGHPVPRSSPKSFPIVPSHVEAPVANGSVWNRLEGSSRRLDDAGTCIHQKTNVRCGTAHSTPSPRPQMTDKVENGPYATKSTPSQSIQQEMLQERLEVQLAPQKHEIEPVDDTGSCLQYQEAMTSATRQLSHACDSHHMHNMSKSRLDATKELHGPQHLRNIEKHGFSMKAISNKWTTCDTPPKGVKMDHSTIPGHQTRSETHQNSFCEPSVLAPSPSPLPVAPQPVSSLVGSSCHLDDSGSYRNEAM